MDVHLSTSIYMYILVFIHAHMCTYVESCAQLYTYVYPCATMYTHNYGYTSTLYYTKERACTFKVGVQINDHEL